MTNFVWLKERVRLVGAIKMKKNYLCEKFDDVLLLCLCSRLNLNHISFLFVIFFSLFTKELKSKSKKTFNHTN